MNKLAATCAIAALGILLGALGAHGLEPQLAANGSTETWRTAAWYHIAHSVALLALLGSPRFAHCAKTFWLWALGILLFSGSLYGLALFELSFLGPITPFGGLALTAGWIALPFEARK